MPIVNPGLRRFISSGVGGIFRSAELNLSNLYSSAIPIRGAVTPAFTRATAKTIVNNDGYQVTLLAGELGFPGARRVYNLWTTDSTALASGANKSLTLPAGAYQFSMGAGTGTATFSGTGGATGTLAASTGRVSVAKTITAGTLVITASVADLVDLQVVSMVAETDQTTIREYVSVGVESAPAYHGSMADGVKCFPTDLSGNPLTGMTTPLIELAATNRCLHSEDFSNAAWVKSNVTVGADSVVTPTGATSTTVTLTAGAANGTVIQDLGVVASAAKSGGLYLKRKTGTGNIDLTLNGGTNWTTQTINSTTWTRCDLSLTVADEDFGIRIVTSGDAIYAWGAMVATEAELTSYIATTTVAVVRNKDELTYTGDLIGTLKSMACVDFKRETGFAAAGYICALSDGTEDNFASVQLANATTSQFRADVGGAPQWQTNCSNAYTPDTLSSAAQSFATNDIKMAKDGVAQTADAIATIPTVTTLEYGMLAGLYQLNGYPGIPYGWTRQLSQSELNAVSA